MENSRKRIRDLRCNSVVEESLGYEFRRPNIGDEDRTPEMATFQDLFCDVIDESLKFKNRPTKRVKSMNTELAIKLKGQNPTVEVASTIYTNAPNKEQLTEANQKEQQYDDFRVSKPSSQQNMVAFECSEGPRLQKFDVGDVVWVKSKRRKDIPVWPAKVIDPVNDAPESVQSVCVPGRFCVKFFHIKNNSDCAYKWANEKRVFSFWDYFSTLEYKSRKFLKSSPKHLKDEFFEAMEVAKVAEYFSGYRIMQDQEEETTCRSCNKKFQASELLPSVQLKQLRNSYSSEMGLLICRHCYKLYKFNQYCGICMKVYSPTTKRGWLRCKKCKIWVHYDCDKVSSEDPQGLTEYSCPQCTPKQPAFATSLIKEKNNNPFTVPERITVVCNDKEASYVTNSHLILCECNECEKGKSMSLSQWEKHVGSKGKKWKQSIRVSDSKQYLIDWLNQAYGAGVRGLGFFNSEGQTQVNVREKELIGWLLEPFEPIKESWIAERCAVCHGAEDWHHNKILMCNGCNIGVHENCYGAIESLDDWLCTACESAKTETTPQRCCLCPVMGGALKPTTTCGFWVHVICACFSNEVTFLNDKTMEPVHGILKIKPDSFGKSCVVCNKMQGSCVKCEECETFYHPTCALIEGYHMERSYWKKKGKDVCTYISYCASHRVPDPNVGVRIPDLDSIHMGIRKEAAAVTDSEDSSDESSSSNNDNNLEVVGLCKIEEPYASRTSVHNRLKAKSGISSIIHRSVGYSHHSRESINKRLKTEREADPPQFSSFRDRLSYCQKNEKNRFRFGKSGVHGYGLFTIEPIRRGEMVIEYRGEIIRNSVANLREKRYQSEGKQSTYMFAIDKETVIDATKKGNAARMINHSCAPNCFSRILPVGVESRIALFAKKDIEADEEITFDYILNKEGGIRERCFCGEATCRKVM